MGLKNKKENRFRPLDLNQDTVQKIFDSCLSSNTTTERIISSIFRKDLGFEESDNPISFDKHKIKENIPSIKYLYGQLYTVHQDVYTLRIPYVSKKYTETQWSTDSRNINEISLPWKCCWNINSFCCKR